MLVVTDGVVIRHILFDEPFWHDYFSITPMFDALFSPALNIA
jgi:hypothetical protein